MRSIIIRNVSGALLVRSVLAFCAPAFANEGKGWSPADKAQKMKQTHDQILAVLTDQQQAFDRPEAKWEARCRQHVSRRSETNV